MQASLFDAAPHFDGPTYEPARDRSRLQRQIGDVRTLMLDGKWRTLEQISDETGHPEASISARLRDLRKARFGAWVVNRRYVSRGLYQYQVKRS